MSRGAIAPAGLISRSDAAATAATSSKHLRWYEPDLELEPLVLSGSVGAAFEELVRQLRCLPRFRAFGVDPPNRLLIAGEPGTGKTLAVRHLGRMLRRPVAVAQVSTIVASGLGETPANVAMAFVSAAARSAILFLDEIEAICRRRDTASSDCAEEMARSTTTMLQQLDALDPTHIFAAATNFHATLDAALRSRITIELTFDLPDRDSRRKMLGKWLALAPMLPCQLDVLADETEGLSGRALRARAMARARQLIMAAPAPKRPSPEPMDTSAFRQGAQEVLRALEGGAA